MTSGDEEQPDESIRIAASDWWSTMRGEPTEDERLHFNAWQEQHPSHAAAYDRIKRRWAQTEPTSTTRASASRTLTQSSLVERRPYLLWGGMTAVAAAALGVVAVETNMIRSSMSREAAVRYAATTSPRSIQLPDRSAVVLAPGTSISASTSSDTRLVRLDVGKGRFDVAHDADRPFTVETPNGSITVHGTLFDVTVAGATTRVSLFRGSVVVRGLGLQAQPIMLRPGERAVVTRDRSAERVANAEQTDQQTMVVLDDVPLQAAIKQVAGARATQLAISPDIRADLKLTGAFRPGDVDGLARASVALFGLRLAHTADGRLLLSTN